MSLPIVGSNIGSIIGQESSGEGAVDSVNGQIGVVVLNAGDVNPVTNRNYATDAQLVVIGNTSGTNTGDQTNITGNAGTATALQTPRNINGVSFNGTADITVTAAAGTLTGTTLNSTVVTSSLTSLGTQGAALNMGSHLINNITDPVSAQDAATKAYVDNAVVGLLDYRGSYDASTNLFPATGGSGTAGAVLKGDFWVCSIAGTLGGTAVTPGDLIIALIDTPGQTAANWDTIDHDISTAVTSVSGTTNRITSTGGQTPVIDISSSYVGQASITTLGTVGTGTWQAGVIAGQYGGTGVANTGKTITLGGNLTTSGAFATTLTATATTTVTLPITGTLATLAGAEAFTNKDLTSGTNTFPTFNQNTTGSAAKWTTARLLAGNSVDGSANAAFANKFIVQGTTDTGLTGAQFLGALTTGLVKNTTTTGVLSIAAAGTDYEVPLTFSTGLTRSTNTITVNTTQNIATLSNLTSNGLVTTSGGAGTLAVTVPGTGVLTALAVNVGSAGAPVTFNGAGGTPSSITLTNASGTASSLTAGAVTNATLTTALTVNTGTVQLKGNAANTSALTIGAGAVSVSGTNTGDQTTVSGNAGTATALQNARTIGGISFDGTANIVPQTIQSINEATDTTCFPLFISASGTQSLQPLNNTALTFNSNTGALGATSFSGAGTGLTGTAASLTAGAVTTNANLTGVITSSGNATSIASQTGTGTKFVVDTSPTLVTPLLGTPTSGTLTNCTGLNANGGLTGTTLNSGVVTCSLTTVGNLVTGTTVNMGTGTAPSTLVGVLSNDLTAVGSPTSGTSDLMTFTIPANALSGVLKGIRISAGGRVTNNINVKAINFVFNGATIASIVPATLTAGVWVFEGVVFKNASNTQVIYTRIFSNNVTFATPVRATGAATDTAGIIVKFTGTGVTASDVVQDYMLIEAIN